MNPKTMKYALILVSELIEHEMSFIEDKSNEVYTNEEIDSLIHNLTKIANNLVDLSNK